MEKISLIVNGEEYTHEASRHSVASLLESLNFAEKKLAVERNMQVVPRERYSEEILQDGDCLEIVHFIGGG